MLVKSLDHCAPLLKCYGSCSRLSILAQIDLPMPSRPGDTLHVQYFVHGFDFRTRYDRFDERLGIVAQEAATMNGSHGEGPGAREAKARKKEELEADSIDTTEIEYLLYQSTQGIHFVFENADIARVLRSPSEGTNFYTKKNMERVQEMFEKLLDRPTMDEKKSFLDKLSPEDFELLIRAYFRLVEKAILENTDVRH
jgi:hypothetical protein